MESHHEALADPPRVHGMLEFGLYVEDVPRAVEFYKNLFGFPPDFAASNPDTIPSLEALTLHEALAGEDERRSAIGILPWGDETERVFATVEQVSEEETKERVVFGSENGVRLLLANIPSLNVPYRWGIVLTYVGMFASGP